MQWLLVIRSNTPGQSSSTARYNEDELLRSLSNLQSTADIMKSPLFSSLVQIQSQYDQVRLRVRIHFSSGNSVSHSHVYNRHVRVSLWYRPLTSKYVWQ